MSIKAIDEAVTEDGFAIRNPQLLATFMQTAVLDFHATRFGQLLEFIDGHLAESLNPKTSLKPPQQNYPYRGQFREEAL